MKQKVLFLGAGFSKAIDKSYPSLLELTQQVLRGDSWIPAVENTMYSQCFSNIPNSFKTNLELLLNYLNQAWPWLEEETSYIHRAFYLDLLKRIVLFIDKLRNNSDLKKYDFFAEWICKNKIDVVSLNYDTLVEEIIENWHIENDYKVFNMADLYSDGGILPLKSRGLLIDTEMAIAETNQFRKYLRLPHIYKLHGSVNWKWAGKNQTDPIYCSWDAYPNKRGEDLIPYIIPPIYDKQPFYGHTAIASIWKQAFRSLVFAEELYIIGFSFPASDISLQYMFKAVLQMNKNLKVYVINTKESVDPSNPSYIKKRYEDVFGREICDFSYCCEDSLKLFFNNIIRNSL